MLLRFCAICKRFARFYSETAIAIAAAVKSFSDLSWQRVCIQSAKRRVATCHMPHAAAAAAAQLTLEALLLLKAEEKEKEQAEVAAASRVGAAAAAAARLRGNL